MRKYAPDHVLLIGRPGSGKSTALARLLLEEAEEGRGGAGGAGGAGGERNFPLIPVLVELRYYQNSVLERVQAFLQQHDPYLDVDEEILKEWLRQGRLLLLFDGFNELPSDEARQQVRGVSPRLPQDTDGIHNQGFGGRGRSQHYQETGNATPNRNSDAGVCLCLLAAATREADAQAVGNALARVWGNTAAIVDALLCVC